MSKDNRDLLVGLDIGTSKVVALVAELTPDGNFNVVGVGQTASKGLKKGVVVNIEATVLSIQKALEDSGVLIENEKDTRHDDPPIYGKVDSFINWKEVEYVVEIKTCNAEAFERHKRSKSASNYHILQLLIYMKIYKKKNGILLYENKNTHEMLAVPVNINKNHVEFVDYLFDWMREVYASWVDKKLPEVPFRSNDIKICQACPLQAACKEAPVGDVKIARRKDEKGKF